MGQVNQATFAGGCFWCLQGPYDVEPGVSNVRVGYAGGDPEQASYAVVASGRTKHREGITMDYDPAKVSYERLLEIFWKNIDPTDTGGQFGDRGYQYTTVIYYHTPEQQHLAETAKQALSDSKKFEQPIATAIELFTTFIPAEAEHQAYYKKNPLQYKMYKRGSGRTGYIERTWAE